MRELVPVLQLSVSPVIVISGVALFMLSMINRYGQIVDKTRSLSNGLRKLGKESPEHHYKQLQIMYARARRVRLAIFFAGISLLMAAVMIISLFLISLLQLEAAILIVILFIACMSALSASLVLFLYDINMSLHALTIEIESHPKREGEVS